jgi:hypothetical protein
MGISARLSDLRVQVPSAFSRHSISSKPRNIVYVDEETLSDYDPVRYYPIKPGSTLGHSYIAVVKLGYGRTSTTWLCKDYKYVRSKASNP